MQALKQLHRMTHAQRCQVVLVLEGDKTRLVPRGELAAEFKANGLEQLARECMAIVVRPGEQLAFANHETEAGIAVQFLKVPLGQ